MFYTHPSFCICPAVIVTLSPTLNSPSLVDVISSGTLLSSLCFIWLSFLVISVFIFFIIVGQADNISNDPNIIKIIFNHNKTPIFYFNFNVKALIATITVLSDIKIAPIAGDKIKPINAKIPAAKGTATIL